MILAIRTDKPEAALYLINRDGEEAARQLWQAHRELSSTIFYKLQDLLGDAGYEQLTGIIVFKGPGSFTGLRIGATVANTLAYSLDIPVVGSYKDDWLKLGFELLQDGQNDTIAVPEYGGEANITKPRK